MSLSDELISAGQNSVAFLALLEKISEERSWWADAKCADADPDLFFPPPATNATGGKEVCQTCPVIQQCREDGKDELYGVWGGTSVEERRDERRQRDMETA